MTKKSSKNADNQSPSEKIPFYTKYKPEFCEQLLNLARQGVSLYKIADGFGVTKRTLEYWANDKNKPEFMEAYLRAVNALQAYMIQKTQDNVENRNFSHQGMDMLWKNLEASAEKRTMKQCGIDFTDKKTYKEQCQHFLEQMREMAFDEAKFGSEAMKNIHLTVEANEAMELLREMKESKNA